MTCRLFFVLCLFFVNIFVISITHEASGEKEFPSRSLTYLVFFDPGGQSDQEARRQQPYLKRILGQPVIIEYRVGAGGALGWKEFARKTRPDGYTFAGFNLPHVILQPSRQDVGYKTHDLEPVALFQRTPLALAVLMDSPYHTLADFIEACRKEPSKITVGGSSIFSASHTATALMEKLTGAKVSYIPFTGTSPQMAAFINGHTDACFANSDDLVRYRDKLRILAFATTERFPEFIETPTFREMGYDLVAATERGVCVPSRTPKEIVQKLEKVFLQIMSDVEVQNEMRKNGSIPLVMGTEQTKAYMQELSSAYSEVVTKAK